MLDPQHVDKRRRRRLQRKYHSPFSKFVWHIDGHDNLKSYAINIHSIDGYSRHIIWLEVARTVIEITCKNCVASYFQILTIQRGHALSVGVTVKLFFTITRIQNGSK